MKRRGYVFRPFSLGYEGRAWEMTCGSRQPLSIEQLRRGTWTDHRWVRWTVGIVVVALLVFGGGQP